MNFAPDTSGTTPTPDWLAISVTEPPTGEAIAQRSTILIRAIAAVDLSDGQNSALPTPSFCERTS